MVNKLELSQRYPGFPDREPMALDSARLILQDVVDTPEDTLTKDDLDRIGDHNAVEVREALTVIGTDLLTIHSHKDRLAKLSLISKRTPYGRLFFGIVRGNDPTNRAIDVGQPELLRMELTTGKEEKHVLESAVLLEDRRATWVSRFSILAERFVDWRGKKQDSILMNDALKDANKGSMDKFKKIHLGLRWVAYNMLNWDNDFKLPEDVNKSPLPSAV